MLTGTGSNSGQWQLPFTKLAPLSWYRFEFSARAMQSPVGGVITAGPDFCTRDYAPSSSWQTYSYVLETPAAGSVSLHLSQWMLKGSVLFRSVTITRLLPVLTRDGAGAVLGDGEVTNGDRYIFNAPLGNGMTTASRPLYHFTASFNSDRWMLGPHNEVIYHHQVGRHIQQAATVRLSCVYDSGCTCLVEAAQDSSHWARVGVITGVGATDFRLPSSLFPSRNVFVRLVARQAPGGSGGVIEIGGYRYSAVLKSSAATSTGSTQFMTVDSLAAGVNANLYATPEPPGRGLARLRLSLNEASGYATGSHFKIVVQQGGTAAEKLTVVASAAKDGKQLSGAFTVSRWGRPGLQAVSISAYRGQERLFTGNLEIHNASYYATNFGEMVDSNSSSGIWWCPAPYKVPPFRPVPTMWGQVHLSAARQERAAVQLVVHPSRTVGVVHVAVGPLQGPHGHTISSDAVTLRREAYVKVSQATDAEGCAGLWPDPLPLLKSSWMPAVNQNNPIWVQITVPAHAIAGNYTTAITFTGTGWHATVPINLHVWNFTLPLKSALRSGFGITPSTIFQYQNIRTPQDKTKVWNLYMKAFHRNRLDPYDPMALDPYTVSLVHGPKGTPHVKLDFTQFDIAAHQMLDKLGFNAFVIQFYGLGGGSYPNYQKGSFLGYTAGTSEYERLMQEYGNALQSHLAEHGWLKKAYVYWTDEPQDSDFPFVKAGMQEIHRVAPALKAILTVHITPALSGDVNIWCSLTNQYSQSAAQEQQRAGNEVWWYICTGPKEPYVGEFIDRPGIDMLMWMWQTWKYGVQGNLIWSVNYWTSPPQFPTKVQNPWNDPMSYVAGPSGEWGNGDGRYLYPPNRHPNTDKTTAFVEGPVPSIRWELLGEGVEQWQYFHLLQQLVDRARAAGTYSHAEQNGSSLLTIPAGICTSMTDYTHDASMLLAYRRRIAQAIEALGGTR
jgi:hypothetical protein